MSAFTFYQFVLFTWFIFICESRQVSLETAELVTNRVVSEQAVPLRDNIKAHAKTAVLLSIHDKLNSAQEEVLPKHEGERTANVCKGAADGDYIDVHNPYGYITCLGGQTYRKNCAPGMKWDNITKSCVRQFK